MQPLGELRHVAEGLVDDLREMENGTITSTYQLINDSGMDTDDFGVDDLFQIHYALLRAASANRITLEFVDSDGKVDGLPFHYEYIVKNKRAWIKCPYCGSKDTARILYGLPAFDEELEKKCCPAV